MRDKLSRTERLRVDCLAQALRVAIDHQTDDVVVERAAKFEEYVKNGRKS